MTTARAAALDILARSHSREGFVAELLDENLTRTGLSAQDRRFVTQLVFGVIRRRGTLDALLKPFIQRPLNNVEPALMDALRLGAFQIAFLTHVPKHAAVHETVELANHIGRGQAKGFLNGVLRRVAETVTDEYTDAPGADALPFEAVPSSVTVGSAAHSDFSTPAGEITERPAVVGRYRKLARPVLPNLEEDFAGYLAAGFSWPRWLADRWLARFGRDEATRLGFWFNAPPSLWLRVNKLKGEREDYRVQLAARNIDADTGPHPQSLRLLEGHSVRDLPGYADGEFAVQDPSAMAVATALNPAPGWRVLDLCAAPGGKTTHLAELMHNRGRIVACDIEAKRLDTVATLCRRLGVSNVEPVLVKDGTDAPAGPFDAALVDAPCSNTGVLGRRPEVRWRVQPGEFEYLIRLQTKLLFAALDRVKPGGVVVYSTCSIEPDENENVVKGVRRGIKGLKVEAEGYAIPGKPADGGYWARLRKPG
ncbi:transcription antitermination factor NusB [Fimbriiglobus ruber]|uniref:Ribosomal RNA small subunit methyltransferase B n=1 Tax=Fimbriiglobus ruber TaxID=1908690 RepID=A0A225E3W2_9BACT|nr:transcription antitermination factor NusB [Fimbriiglobus ruber]OWK43375.1 Ribosomal RNA small subunit methyltransferase B [Fimbriiglobus ruber]